ncbi:MAG: hypothetical protein K6A69_01210 [Lachnospiraceae bacterium]|nr:hypothetical protein [Lachnospiraceae bacterium]
MTRADEGRIYKEIINYAKSEENYSYYEIEEYAYLNKPEWYEALHRSHHIRSMVAEYFRGARKKQKMEGKNPRSLAESIEKIEKDRDNEPDNALLFKALGKMHPGSKFIQERLD